MTSSSRESDACPGGKIHYTWANDQGHSFSLTGEYEALEPFSRIVHVERMHLPAEFVKNMRALIGPGTTVLVTQASVSADTTGRQTTVIDAELAPKKKK